MKVMAACLTPSKTSNKVEQIGEQMSTMGKDPSIAGHSDQGFSIYFL